MIFPKDLHGIHPKRNATGGCQGRETVLVPALRRLHEHVFESSLYMFKFGPLPITRLAAVMLICALSTP